MNTSTPITELRGVGPKTAALLRSKNLNTLGDLAQYYPSRYDEYSMICSLSAVREGETAAVLLTVIGRGSVIRAGGRTLCHFRAGDATGDCRLTFYNMPYIVKSLPPASQRVFRGVIKKTSKGGIYMDQPSVFQIQEYKALSGRLMPVYPLFSGIKARQMSALVQKALDALPPFDDYLSQKERAELSLIERDEAMRAIHAPSGRAQLGSARNRLIFDEFFYFILAIRKQKRDNDVMVNDRPLEDDPLPDELVRRLPYSLTGAQQRAFEEIRRDLTGGAVMSRLLQGDVGSGKTIIAFLALILCSANKRQGALMAPTEVLATQHMRALTELADTYSLPIHPVLMTGSVKGKARRTAYEQIASGEADIVIGTHALIQEAVKYHDLGLVVTDERHRFGVRQRESLTGKGEQVPVLVMSATPIPRTLAIILYGDLQISVLDEMPPGRLPIKNLAIDDTNRARVFRFIMGQIREGRQAYIICPEVEEGENSTLQNVTDYAKRLQRAVPDGVSVDMLHGRMKPAEKNEIMERFIRHETDILVSTTVIEVGIDVPNASVILIENAERFGMSALHQLRGRVGRGKWQSYCIFMYTKGAGGDPGKKPRRLEILEHNNDGFVIAEEDLKMRGPGDLFGERQSGDLGFILADIYEDNRIMQKAAAYVDEVLARDPDYEPAQMRRLDVRTI